MTMVEKLEHLYDDIKCEISFCNSVEEILDVIDSSFAEIIGKTRR